MSLQKRVIFHIDGDSFFVSAELTLRPELKDKDVAISYNKPNSIVSALSYSAKSKGAKVPMRLHEVKKFCPDLINIPPNYFLYQSISDRVFKYLQRRFPNRVEIGSIDEWFVDVTDFHKRYNSPKQLAKEIQSEILHKFAIDVSIGISYNKFLAKIATEMNKPKGITILRKKDIEEKVWPLDINKYIGIGKKLSQKLQDKNILTIGDLANIDRKDPTFRKIFKNQLDIYINNANGIGSNKIDLKNNEFLSFGNQHSFDSDDSCEVNNIYKVIFNLSKNVSAHLEKKSIFFNQLKVSIKTLEGKLLRTSKKFLSPICDADTIYENSLILFNKIWDEKRILMVGISVSLFSSKYKCNENLKLFEEKQIDNEQKKIIEIINNVNRKIKSNNLKLLVDIKK